MGHFMPANPMSQHDLLPGRSGSAWIGIVTIIDEEFEAVRDRFDLKVRIPGTTRFYARKEEPSKEYGVVLVRCLDRGNGAAGETIKQLIEHFFPRFILVIGIAGGAERDKIKLGDVIVSDYIDYYELMKISDNRLIERRTPYDHPSLHIRDCAEGVRYSKWTNGIPIEPPEQCSPKAVVGHIAAGEKLFDDKDFTYQRQILEMFDKTVGVDMESYGVARAIFHSRQITTNYNPLYLVIRGVSDIVWTKPNENAKPMNPEKKEIVEAVGEKNQNNSELREKWRVFAANSAAAFGLAVAAELIGDKLDREPK